MADHVHVTGMRATLKGGREARLVVTQLRRLTIFEKIHIPSSANLHSVLIFLVLTSTFLTRMGMI